MILELTPDERKLLHGLVWAKIQDNRAAGHSDRGDKSQPLWDLIAKIETATHGVTFTPGQCGQY